MKKKTAWSLVILLAAAVHAGAAEPIRVGILDFEVKTGLTADSLLGGAIPPEALAEKGVFALGEALLGDAHFVLVDRRDFINRIEALRPRDMGEATPARPSFLQAAQALNLDVVLRGSLLAFSTSKRVVRQGGFETEMATPSARIGLEALDARDGTVIAMSAGVAEQTFRQTKDVHTVLSENDVMAIVEAALADALPPVTRALGEFQAKQQARPAVKLSVKTSADPALVEVDGLLVGSTPLDSFEVYQGDHVLTVGKPGYQDVTKRILLDRNVMVEVPMIRLQLSAEELKEVLESMRLSVHVGEPAIVVHPLD